MSCTVNPIAGRELDRGDRPRTAAPQRWTVVGGGPAGMRAAIELASDGHAVTLVEAAEELGGQLRLARRVPGRESVGLLVDDLVRDLAAAGVDVRLGARATADDLRREAADGIVVATGAVAPQTTSLALGGAYDVGFPAGSTVDAFTAASDPARLGGRIAVVDDDGTAYAAGVVLTLLAHVDALDLVTPFESVFPHIGAGYDRPLLLERLGAHPGFGRRTSHAVAAVRTHAVDVRDALTGATATLEGLDAVVAIEPRASVAIEGIEDAAPRVITIGDAYAPRTIDAAIFEAVELAYDVAGLAVLRG